MKGPRGPTLKSDHAQGQRDEVTSAQAPRADETLGRRSGPAAPGARPPPPPGPRRRDTTLRGGGRSGGGGGGPRRSSPRSWAGRAAPERRCVRAGLGVRDGSPSAHAGRPPRPSPVVAASQSPRIQGSHRAAGVVGRGLARTPTQPPGSPSPAGHSPRPRRGKGRSRSPFPEARARVTRRRANGEAARRRREVGGAARAGQEVEAFSTDTGSGSPRVHTC